MFGLSTTELMIILLIVVLLFGAGRIGKVAGELGNAVSSFRKGLSENKDPEDPKSNEQVQ
jgi:sec-independent protein translocase protein TatA